MFFGVAATRIVYRMHKSSPQAIGSNTLVRSIKHRLQMCLFANCLDMRCQPVLDRKLLDELKFDW